MAKKYRHRVAFNCDLFIDVTSDIPEPTPEQIQDATKAALYTAADYCSDDIDITEIDFGVMNQWSVYPRIDNQVLENLSVENSEEIP